MSNLLEDLKQGSQMTVGIFFRMGKLLDYSVDSLLLIEEVIKVHFEKGQPTKGGLFEEGMGGKLFGIGAYLGEVILRHTNNTKWKPDPDAPDDDFIVMIESQNGAVIWPQQKLFKRVFEGEADNIHFYATAVIRSFNEEK